jgi:hypothetical protein
MIEALITSKTRVKLLLKFFLNSTREDYLRNLESDLGDNTNAIRLELNRMEDAGLLNSFIKGNRKYFKSNTAHPLFKDINSILMKITGLDQVLERVTHKIGNLQLVYLGGDLALGNSSEIIDLIFIGSINQEYLHKLIVKTEQVLNKKIKYLVFDAKEFELKKERILTTNDLLLWKK